MPLSSVRTSEVIPPKKPLTDAGTAEPGVTKIRLEISGKEICERTESPSARKTLAIPVSVSIVSSLILLAGNISYCST